MRVVHVVQRYHPSIGGAETHVRSVAEEQARRGHDVSVFTSAAPGAPARSIVGGVTVVRLPARHWRGDYLFPPWLPMRDLDTLLTAAHADVIHAHSYRFATVEAAARASRVSGTPLVVTAHGFYPPENALVAASRAAYDLTRGRRALSRADRCVAVTPHEIAHYEALGVDPARVEVVPNGLPASAFEPGDGAAFRKAHGLNGPVVLFLARLAHDKGVRDLVRAARRVPEATFIFCGRDAGEERAARRLAPPNVRFLGPVPDPRDAYAACDVFCLPSHYEAFGIVLAEAMAQRRAIVATRAGGIPEVVGEAGVLVEPHDPPALAAAIRALLRDPEGRQRRGALGHERAGEFLWTRVVDLLEGVYARAIAP